MKYIISILPLLFFITLVFLSGYFVWQELKPAQAVVAARPTPTTRPSPPSPTPVATPTSSPTSPRPTATATPTATPTSAPPAPATATLTPLPTPTIEPLTLVWVRTDSSNPIDPVHTLGLSAPGGVANPSLQTYVAAPALSPDGQTLAFFSESSLSGLNTGIWLDEVNDGIINEPILLADVTNVQNMAWSPDGDKIAFEVIVNPENPPAEWRSEVRVIRGDPTGGYIQLAQFDGRQPAWSPGSQTLAAQICKGSQCGLFLIDCAGGNCDYDNATQVTFDSTDSYPAWSVDGMLAFTSKRDGNHEIYLLQLADGNLRNLTNRPSTDITPVFSPDGQKIYFRTDFPEGAEWQIQVMTLDNSRQAVQEIITLIEDVGGDDQSWGLVRPIVR